MRKRVLCDENLPHKLRVLIPEHDLFTVAYMGWIGVKNGHLLSVAECEGFDVLITSDQGFPHQQNMSGRNLAVLLLPTPDWKIVKEQAREIVVAIDAAKPRTFVHMRSGEPTKAL